MENVERKEKSREYYLKNRDKILECTRIRREEKKKSGVMLTAEQRESNRRAVDKYQKANREKVIAASKRHYQENKEEYADHHRKYVAENRGHVYEYNASIRSKYPERYKEYRRKYVKANPEKIRILTQNRRAKIKSLNGKLSSGLAERLLRLQKGKCISCRTDLNGKYHLDHIVPIALGGENLDVNIQLLCPTCNCKKQAKDPIDFMQSRGFLL